jgi:hypothetical protein
MKNSEGTNEGEILTLNETEILTPEHAAELLRRQDELQSESRAVLQDLNLVSLLSHAGKPIQLGSSILGLMVWRDIDMDVSSPGLSIDRALEIRKAWPPTSLKLTVFASSSRYEHTAC